MGGSQGPHVFKALQKTRVVRQHRTHLGLLQHDFGEPDPVRVTGALPWQIVSAMGTLPAHQRAGQIARRGSQGFWHVGHKNVVR